MGKYIVKMVLIGTGGSLLVFFITPLFFGGQQVQRVTAQVNNVSSTVQREIDSARLEVAAQYETQEIVGKPPPPVVKEDDHYELAKQYIKDKDWNGAMAECKLALKDNPDDIYTLQLKRQILTQGKKWGVTKASQVAVYKKSGGGLKLLRHVEAGTLLDVTGKQKTAKGEFSICNVLYKGKEIADIMIMSESLDIRDGSLRIAGEKERSLFSQRGVLIAQMYKTKDSIISSTKKNSDVVKNYNAAKDKYRKYWAKVKTLQAKRDASSGNDHVELEDELRKMKGTDITVGKEYKKTKKAYDSWKSKTYHRVNNDPRLLELKSRLKNVTDMLNAIKI